MEYEPRLSLVGKKAPAIRAREWDSFGWLRWGLEVIALALIYCSVGLIGIAFAIPPGNASPIWPASGLALAAMVVWSPWLWPGIWIGALMMCLLGPQPQMPFSAAALIAAGNTLSAVIGAFLVQRWYADCRPFESPIRVFLWLTICTVSSMFAAVIGVFTLVGHGAFDWTGISPQLGVWWIGDLGGMMVFAPFLISFRDWKGSIFPLPRLKLNPKNKPWLQPLRMLELILAQSLIVIMGMVLFRGWISKDTAAALEYLPLVILVWLLIRFGFHMGLVATVLFTITAVYGTAQGSGIFASSSQSVWALIELQLFLILFAFAGLVIHGILCQWQGSLRNSERLKSEIRMRALQMDLARDIQSRLFPETPLDGSRFRCAGVCQPADETGGDYFDFIPQSDGSLVIAIADVSGHGVGAAILMAETRAYLRALLAEHLELEQVVARLNQFLFDDTQMNVFVTALIGKYSPTSARFEYIGAGHDGLLICGNGACQTLGSSTIPLGVNSSLDPLQAFSVPLVGNDQVVLLTDGFAETLSPSGEMFGEERTIDILSSNRNREPGELLEALSREVTVFARGKQQSDDRTGLVLRIV